MKTCETLLTEIKARLAKAPLPPLFDWDEDSLRVAYLNGGLAKATYDMQCRYIGRDHEGTCIRIIEDSIRTAVRTDLETLVAMVECARDALEAIMKNCNEKVIAFDAGLELDRLANGEGK